MEAVEAMTTEPVYFPDDPFGPCKPVRGVLR
jgi:hypothetical protein